MTQLAVDSSSSLEVKNLKKSFSGLQVLRDVSFTIVGGGHTVGIIGPNGAGKTTLFNVILGLVTQDGGTVRLNGISLDGISPWRRARLGLGCLWQDSRVFRGLTALENLLVAAKDLSDWGVMDFLIRRREQRDVELARKERADEVLQRIGLTGKERTVARDLSYGQQRLLALGRLLVNLPGLLLLDEPVAGLDPVMVDSVLKLIQELRTEGKSILIIEHDPFVVRSVADVVYTMRDGLLAIGGPPNDENWWPSAERGFAGL